MKYFNSTLCTVLAVLGLTRTEVAACKPSLEWSKCPNSGFTNEFDCGSVQVPLNHAEPDGEKISLFVSRLNSTSDNRDHVKPLYVEVGGPGGSNQDFPLHIVHNDTNSGAGTEAVESLRRNFDIIAMDIRGSNYSHLIRCSPELYNELQWPIIKDQETYDKTMAAAKAFGESCKEMTGPLLEWVSTDQIVQDFEAVRQALHHDKFNYLGFSYGTRVGYKYAERYPDKVGRMVLDGLTAEDSSAGSRILTSAVGLDSVLQYFFDWCEISDECALHSIGASKVFESILSSARNGTLKAGDRTVHDWQVVLTIQPFLHDGIKLGGIKNFQVTSSVLNATYATNNGSFIVEQPYTSDQTAKEIYAQFAISCADRDARVYNASDFANIYTVAGAMAPISRGFSFDSKWFSICQHWPFKAHNSPRALDLKQMRKAPPILLVNSLWDSATFIPYGLRMREQIPTGVSIYRNGPGHTAWLHFGETANAMVKYLVKGVLPSDGRKYET